jgi:ferredoxin-NADP reductase
MPISASRPVWTAELVARRALSRWTFEVGLRRPAGFRFAAGQHVRFRSRQLEREYSMVSGPEDDELRFCVRDVGTGQFSRTLATASIGESFSFTGPHGYFRFRPSERTPLFVATGTGIAPFVSMVRDGVAGFVLLHGVRAAAECYYADLLEPAADRYVPCLTAPESTRTAFGEVFRGRVTDCLNRHLPVDRYDAYLCGRREMIRDVTLLLDERFPDSRVFSEIFF